MNKELKAIQTSCDHDTYYATEALCMALCYHLYEEYAGPDRDPLWEETTVALVGVGIMAIAYLKQEELSVQKINEMIAKDAPIQKDGSVPMDKVAYMLPESSELRRKYQVARYTDSKTWHSALKEAGRILGRHAPLEV